MKIGTNGLNLIKQFEGCRLTAYNIDDGKITIGWGHAEPVGQTNLVAGVTTWTQAQADNQLTADLVDFENAVNNYFTRSFNQNQFDALVAFAYNLGGGVFANYNWSKTASDSWICSEMILYVNKGTQYEEGLTRRRKAEIALYNSSSSNTPGGSGTSSWTWPFTTPYKGKADIPEQQFGTTPLRRGRGYFHDGFDFGSTSYGPDILALSDGEVIYTGVMGDGLGSVIVLSIPPYQVMYQEFSKSMGDIFVSVGQKVTKGQRIGRLNGGTHLHLGITQKNWRTALSSWDVDDGSWLNPIDVIQKEMNNSQEEKGDIEMILYKVTDSKSKMNGSIWLFNGEQLTRLDGTSAAKLGQSLKTVDINQAEMSSLKNIGIRTVGDFQY
ncbi:glycoside hydrolase family protein [Lactococcus lactis]|uniref:glycoside hydrolase family protein n=1 Tax=Lactococcus lactis TaxID=1358 RepID=UPI00071C3718|nr:glycoside hydrolase family protein [Lactococcus lactis]KST98537.1 Phage-related lysozyme [Lactococcus lactis subsp. lactis]